MRAVAYARVSSASQRERDTIASQLRVLPEYIARQGWTLVMPIDTYVDDGLSAKAGRLIARRGLAALLRDAAASLFDVVVVVDVDRLTRAEDLAERGMILGALQVAGVKVASAIGGEVLDLNSDFGDLMASMKASFAASENRKRSSRVREGKITAASRGGKSGGLDPYGLTFAKPASWSFHPEQASIVREIVERVASGATCYAIADDLNAREVPYRSGRWNRSRVWDVVTSRHIVGEYNAHSATRTIAPVPPIVSEELWQAARAQLVANRTGPLRRTKHIYLLEALARCGACGGRIMINAGHWSKGKFWTPPRYICEHRKYRKMGPDRCTAPNLEVADVDARLWAMICREVVDPQLAAELAADRMERAADQHDWELDAAGYRKHLARLDRVAEKHLERYRRDVLTDKDFDNEMAAVNRERAAVRAQLATAERARRSTVSAKDRAGAATATVERLRARLDQASLAERREIVETLVDPGGVVFRDTALHVELFVERPGTLQEDGTAHGSARVSLGGPETYLRIRAVA